MSFSQRHISIRTSKMGNACRRKIRCVSRWAISEGISKKWLRRDLVTALTAELPIETILISWPLLPLQHGRVSLTSAPRKISACFVGVSCNTCRDRSCFSCHCSKKCMRRASLCRHSSRWFALLRQICPSRCPLVSSPRLHRPPNALALRAWVQVL
jgi:hypothetical protein